jgi:exo-beta-1,3-glucanase (GH17 family)
VWQDYPSLCDAVTDTVHVNIQPFYNGATSPSDAGTFLLSQQEIVVQACPGKNVVVSEAGWPSAGGNNGAATASAEDQQAAISSIWQATNGDVTFFSFLDDQWKAAGPEQHFGIPPPLPSPFFVSPECVFSY